MILGFAIGGLLPVYLLKRWLSGRKHTPQCGPACR